MGLAVVGMFVLGLVFAVQSGDPRWLFIGLPFTLMLFVIGRFAPTGYRLGPEGVEVERRAGTVLIPYRRIRAVDREPRALAGLTVFGSRGVFGHFGRFWSARLGFYRLFVTDRESVVWLATDDGWIGLSPERPDEFVARLQERLGPGGRR